MSKCVFLGLGRMATALLETMKIKRPCWAVDPRSETFAAKPFVQALKNLNELELSHQDWVFVCVEPQKMKLCASAQAPGLQQARLVSIAAGWTLESLEKLWGDSSPILRCMPNTAVKWGKGMAFIAGNERTQESDLSELEDMLKPCGRVWRVEEKLFDVLTVVSGSGPAIVSQIMKDFSRLLEDAGLSKNVSQEVVVQLLEGVTLFLDQAPEKSWDKAIDQVVTAGGCTAKALEVMESEALSLSLQKALLEAARKAKSLGLS